ncbi:hypothetical protein TRIUR3_29169 [Triticum urartu]|uniref:Uncharacterized protein n=1 Tax=Triticum urartu TaxID=4572 RepID=M7YIX1_TRIUA|nr:hypothetical protein TRIUR3_29169 [Triticum urartu]
MEVADRGRRAAEEVAEAKGGDGGGRVGLLAIVINIEIRRYLNLNLKYTLIISTRTHPGPNTKLAHERSEPQQAISAMEQPVAEHRGRLRPLRQSATGPVLVASTLHILPATHTSAP